MNYPGIFRNFTTLPRRINEHEFHECYEFHECFFRAYSVDYLPLVSGSTTSLVFIFGLRNAKLFL